MITALVYNNSVESFYEGGIPPRIYFKNGGTADGAAVGYLNENGYSILPVTFVDSGPPQPTSYEDVSKRTYAISGGTVQVTRVWVTPPAQIPPSCTRAQGLLALLNNGFATPEATITTAINAISDSIQQQTAMIKFQAANWYRADPFIESLGGVLGLTSNQIDALFIAAQAY